MADRDKCPIRHVNGNCLPIGGFCTAITDEICKGLRMAYEKGQYDSVVALLKEQEAVEPHLDVDEWKCGNCGHDLEHQEMLGDNVLFHEQYNYCPNCGKKVKWN